LRRSRDLARNGSVLSLELQRGESLREENLRVENLRVGKTFDQFLELPAALIQILEPLVGVLMTIRELRDAAIQTAEGAQAKGQLEVQFVAEMMCALDRLRVAVEMMCVQPPDETVGSAKMLLAPLELDELRLGSRLRELGHLFDKVS
jgi:hypothetical protein